MHKKTDVLFLNNSILNSMFYTVLPIIALFAIIYIYRKAEAYFDDGINYDSSEAADILYKHIHNKIITENKNPSVNYFQFNNITLPTLHGEKRIESLLISPQGLFVFKPLHFDTKVTETEMGFSLINNNGSHIKLSINTIPDTDTVNHLNHLFNQIDNLPIHYLTVFTSDLDTTINSNNLITLDQVEYNIVSKMETLSARDIQYVIGQLIMLEKAVIKTSDSFAA